MPYTKRIICLASSYKPPNGRCFAGRELLQDGRFGAWIRPVSSRNTAEVSLSECKYENNAIPKLLDIIDVKLLKAAPHNHQTENHLLDATQCWKKTGEFQWKALEDIRQKPASIWLNGEHTTQGVNDCLSEAKAATLDSSLMLIKSGKFTVEIGTNTWNGVTKKTWRGRFDYEDTHYNFSLTDPRARDVFSKEGHYELKDVYLCLSLTEPFEKDHRCHKLVAAILRNPPL